MGCLELRCDQQLSSWGFRLVCWSPFPACRRQAPHQQSHPLITPGNSPPWKRGKGAKPVAQRAVCNDKERPKIVAICHDPSKPFPVGSMSVHKPFT